LTHSTDNNEKFPKLIRILPGNRVEIDGKEFPWYITEHGVQVDVGSRQELTSVTLTVPCDRVEIDDQLSGLIEITDGTSLGAVARIETPRKVPGVDGG